MNGIYSCSHPMTAGIGSNFKISCAFKAQKSRNHLAFILCSYIILKTLHWLFCLEHIKHGFDLTTYEMICHSEMDRLSHLLGKSLPGSCKPVSYKDQASWQTTKKYLFTFFFFCILLFGIIYLLFAAFWLCCFLATSHIPYMTRVLYWIHITSTGLDPPLPSEHLT